MHRYLLSRLVVAVLAVLLSGCASTAFKENIVAPAYGQATVSGNVELVEDGKKLQLGLWSGQHIGLLVQRAGDTEVVQYIISAPGTFFWSLPPGEYMILGFVGARGVGSIRMQFTVPTQATGLYVGDLVFTFHGSNYTVDVVDRLAAGIEAFRAKFPGTQIVPERAIAQKEKPPGSFARVTSVCREWGIECTRSVAGVAPTYPADPRNGVVDSLTPALKWAPSPQSGVTYDVVIYEEQKFPRNPLGAVQDSLPGRQVHYAQDLTEPMLKLDSALRPGTSYQWSVRLRRGDVVSSWSTFGYFDFFLVGWASGSGQWFTFSTPAR